MGRGGEDAMQVARPDLAKCDACGQMVRVIGYWPRLVVHLDHGSLCSGSSAELTRFAVRSELGSYPSVVSEWQ